MEKVYSLNNAPEDYKKFKRWYKAACNFPLTADEAWVQLLKRKLPDEHKPTKKEVE